MLVLLVSATAGVLVNEVMYDPDSTDDGNEWIELCNNGAESVDLTGWTIESGGSGFEVCYELGAGSIAPGEYVIVGAGGTVWAGAFDPNLQNGSGDADGVRLLDAAGNVVDTVLYGGTGGVLVDDAGNAGRGGPSTSAGNSLARWDGAGDCFDSDDASVDFVESENPSPGGVNPAPGGDTGDTGDTGGADADCTAVADIRLNELLSNPEGDDADAEWVELFNRGGAAVDVSGWVVRAATKSTGGSSVTLEAGTSVEAGGFLVVGAGGVGSFSSIGNGTAGDGVYLECGGAIVDSVVYGDDNTDALPDDWGTAATSLASIPADGVSLARRQDGVDTDQSGDDWTSASVNTPGAANQTPQCDPAGAEGLRINEVLYDAADDDTTQEWVELYNAGDAPILLEGYVLEAAKSSWKANATLPAGATLAPGAFYLIGGGDVEGADYTATGLDLGQGTGADGVRVYSCDGALLDTVLYGDENTDGLEGDGGATDVVGGVGAGESIGRWPDGEDTDRHTDLVPYDTPTPGAPNTDPGAVDTGDDSGDTGGDTGIPEGPICGPDPERPDAGSCAALPLPLGGLELVAAAVVAMRRRRPTRA